MKIIYNLAVCVLTIIHTSKSQVNNYNTWDAKKAEVDFSLNLTAASKALESRSYLEYGDSCSWEQEEERLKFSLTLVDDINSLSRSDDLVPLITALQRKSWEGFNGLRGPFCNARLKMTCTKAGTCDCEYKTHFNHEFVWDGDFCRIKEATPCPIVDIFGLGKFIDNGPKSVDVEAKKCAGGRTCIIKENGQKCTQRNVRREVRAFIANTSTTLEQQKAFQKQLNEKIEKTSDYCICGGYSSKVSTILLVLTILASTIHKV